MQASTPALALCAHLAAHCSIEATTRNIADIDRYPGLLRAGTEVTIPWLPGAPFHHTLSAAQRLRHGGFVPVPHVAARRLDSRESALAWLSQLSSEAGVDRVILIAGDAERSVGPYDNALQVIESGVLQACGITRVGIGAYPEGHPRIASDRLERALRDKLDAAARAGLEVQIVSQFCFEGATIIGWLRALRESGIDALVRVGLAGPASVRSLLAYATRCGIGSSVRAVWSGPVSLRDLLSRHGPDQVMIALVDALLGDASLGPVELHLYPFGGFQSSADWVRRLGEGGLTESLANAPG
jgi:methylenetetrahydrofolate reductase (NADPH)